ncbi:hypothetical protein ABZV93_13170 [Actinopolymorpha sp. NPDC004070]|uniref:hypothetical protein n=1 Tax=Actinopolymorpha sp. NPDC004070 TaxID=3154548 RepID=UPI0033B7FE78
MPSRAAIPPGSRCAASLAGDGEQPEEVLELLDAAPSTGVVQLGQQDGHHGVAGTTALYAASSWA